jgi:hypothetical protein
MTDHQDIKTRSLQALTLLGLIGLLGLASIQPGSSQDEGILVGDVKLDGAPPAPRPPAVVKPADAPVCGAHIPDESVLVDREGGLQNVIVYLDDVTANTPGSRSRGTAGPAPSVRLANRDCRFQPHVQTARLGATLIVANDDNILHNTHAYLDQNVTFFNLGLPFKGVEVPRPLKRTGMVTFKCDAGHTWMNGYLLVLDHGFHAVTDASGKFRITSVPTGNRRLKAWHEKLGSQTLSVQISPGQETRINIWFKSQ